MIAGMARQGQTVGNNSFPPSLSRDSTPAPLAIHASAVAIGGRAIIIRGPSKAGKSSLALALIEASTPAQPVKLIGDDRVILSCLGGDVRVSPHPRIAGMIEKRGYGIVSMPYAFNIPLAGAVDLRLDDGEPLPVEQQPGTCRLLEKDFPSLHLYRESIWMGRRQVVLDWVTATLAAHSA
jgi:HPr kinase/phosphorylase